MATLAGAPVTQGWGTFLPDHISLAVDNNAIGGRSARSFTREGRFTAMAAEVASGDYVIIAFGHNDGGSLSTDNGRTDCGVVNNDYSTTCQTTYNGVQETVQTYYTYLVNAVKLFQAKGANVIVASQTSRNVWTDGTYGYTPSRFVGYARDVAAATGATFVDHGFYMAALYNKAGSTTVNSYYPNDQLHTSPAGAKVAARAFILGLDATNNSLKNYITKR
ncbi:Putative SGNH hydrolase-type esterase domain, SGNH hydrolase superfamily [Septoria linicola]|uniref:SGNH hydrolase-type esterase domain, SGNH hydrolase superfamily n=1 Tax=Septoria linicola TaxID=215465 RepID=A0A9Q9B1P6_9PEZI|nr:putative SGNH hydrolase-type esterase domain, SGNH hydrolase superfamily [Septoria linicola]USW56575.1 Putative SGNH hydrolase-type esterase domain, SGNH hydrolase superfamily [Septoria linicola]